MESEQSYVGDGRAKHTRLWRALLIVFAGFVAALSVQYGLGNALESRNPQLAVQIDAGNGSALSNLANARMLAAKTPEEIPEIAKLGSQALIESPLQIEALRTIGFIEDGDGNATKARQILGIASKISKRDALTQAWLFDRYYREGRMGNALEAADIVMRQERGSWDFLVAELLKFSDDPRMVNPIAQTLSYNPNWRGTFLEGLGRSGKTPQIAYQIFRRLQTLGQPANTAELTAYFSRFHDASMPALSWQSWTDLVPAAKSGDLIRDGGFEGIDAPPPYNWSFYQSDGVYAERVANPKGVGRALYLSYGGDSLANFANQMLALKPGTYRLALNVYAEAATTKNQFILYLRCGGINTTREIEKIDLTATLGQWSTKRLDFKVDTGCPTQQIWVSGLGRPGSKDATMWLDNVRLTPL
ncbi:MAG: hypothetical protein AABY88_05390 [Pseudomonadota bacterium]